MIKEIIKFLLVVFVIYLVYRSGLHKKIYKVLNQWIGDTKIQQAEAVKRKRYVKKLLRRMKHNDEI